jgi:diguanylate cyclase (GGDEF)-like protein
LEVHWLTSVVQGLPTMKANTALCFILGGAALVLSVQDAVGTHVATRRLALALLAVQTVLAAVTLSQYLLGWNAGVDLMLFDAAVTDAAAPGRMSMTTATLFMLLGIGLLLQLGWHRMIAVGQGIVVVSGFVALLCLLSYVFGADIARVTAFSSVAVHTAVGFMVLTVGGLSTRGTEGWVNTFFVDTPSARLGRRYLLIMLLTLPTLALLRIWGQRNLDWYGTYFGIAILTTGSIATLALFTWVATRAGNLADKKIQNLARVNATLSGINTLIVRVREQDELFREACTVATKVGKFPWVWIATVDPENGRLMLQAHGGGTAQIVVSLQQLFLAGLADDGIFSQLVRNKAPVVVDGGYDLGNHPDEAMREHRALLTERIQSAVMLPLMVAGEVVGVLALHAETPDFFDAAEMHLLAELAGDISFAINNLANEKKFHNLAYFDPLTQLPNRRTFMDQLGREVQLAARTAQKVVVFIVDLKRFHAINDSLGRHVGDELLRQYAIRVRAHLKNPENFSRVNADRFASFFVVSEASAAETGLGNAFSFTAGETFHIDGQVLTVDATAGVAVFPEDGTDGEMLMMNADIALNAAKRKGNRIGNYETGMAKGVADTLKLENRLRGAIGRGELALHYQPKVDFSDRHLQSVEALMRWNDPTTGLVSPAQFIPLMEEVGLIEEAGAWALRQAVADIGRWRAMGLKAPRVAVNVSAVQLRSRDFLAVLKEALEGFGNLPALIDIEVTESMLVDNVAQNKLTLNAVRAMGIEIAIDDFGTGHSSLAHLAQLPITALKIDRAFVVGMADQGTGVAIVEAIISLARALGLKVIAEGVETEEQAGVLQRLHCDLMQGYLYSKPVPFDQLAAMLPAAPTSAT